MKRDLKGEFVWRPVVIAFQHRDKVTTRYVQGGVVGGMQVFGTPAQGFLDYLDARILVSFGYFKRLVRGAVVHNDLFPVVVSLPKKTFNALAKVGSVVVGRRYDGNERRVQVERCLRACDDLVATATFFVAGTGKTALSKAPRSIAL